MAVETPQPHESTDPPDDRLYVTAAIARLAKNFEDPVPSVFAPVTHGSRAFEAVAENDPLREIWVVIEAPPSVAEQTSNKHCRLPGPVGSHTIMRNL